MRTLVETKKIKDLTIFKGRYIALLFPITAKEPVNERKHLKE